MWPAVEYESFPWKRDPDELAFVPKSRRRKIASTYEAAVPAAISHERLSLPANLVQRMAEVEVAVARFDQEQRSRGYNLPALLLRSESSSSSQIERLTSSVRNVALAEVSDKAPANARLIANNVTAMQRALEHEGPMSVDLICAVHDTLMRDSGEMPGLRSEQVWIGGTPYSPHGASFVPPHFCRVPACLDDLVAFAAREDVSPSRRRQSSTRSLRPFTPLLMGMVARAGRSYTRCSVSMRCFGTRPFPFRRGCCMAWTHTWERSSRITMERSMRSLSALPMHWS